MSLQTQRAADHARDLLDSDAWRLWLRPALEQDRDKLIDEITDTNGPDGPGLADKRARLALLKDLLKKPARTIATAEREQQQQQHNSQNP